MHTRPLVILGSSRKESETKKFLHQVFAGTDFDLVDLLDFQIAPYDYSGRYPEEDGFIAMIDDLLRHDVIVFATPVYWYAMSGLMKTFFDRFTDLVTLKKHLGRQLKGKSTLLLAVGSEEELPEAFEIPFLRTSDYLGMSYLGCIYCSIECPPPHDVMMKNVQSFIANLKQEQP